LNFNGVELGDGSTVGINHSLLNIGQDEYTIQLWFRPDNLSQISRTLFNTQPHTGVAMTFNNNNSMGYVSYLLGPADAMWDYYYIHGPFNSFQTTEWYSLALVKQETTYYQYINGVLESTYLAPASASYDYDIQLRISGINSEVQIFHGDMDDVGIWNRALTETEIQALYTAEIPISGCTDETACNFDQDAIVDDGSCIPSGCMDADACNFNSEAECEGEACDYTCCPGPGCCSIGHYWDWELEQCFDINPTDTNLDGCTDLNDLMDILSAYGDCGAGETVWQCGTPLEYQGYDYETVQIGDQCWFAENLRADALLDETSLSQGFVIIGQPNVTYPAYYLHPEYNYEIEYGKLYNAYSFQNSNEICPQEWHIPNDLEWVTLRDFVGGSAIAGTKLKEQGNQHWSDGNTGDDEYGFSVRGGGWVFGGYSDYRSGARFWSIDNDCSGCPDGCANVWDFYYNYEGFGANHNCIGSDHASSIRCIKD
jgi:uncharacterized protein (TIGR02145 family)